MPGATDRKSTTTVSTIAIKAGDHTRIVLAALKSDQWVHLRIDQMTPGLLEVGRHLDESENLLALHQDLMARLHAKQENIEDLLSQADKLVLQQRECDVPVYEAMAESLGTAWKDLNKQLQIRGLLLETAVQFFANVDKHDQLRRKMEREMRIGSEYTANAEMLQRWLRDMEQMRKDLIDATANAMEFGQQTMTHLLNLGSLDDNPERPKEMLEAIQKIEGIMLNMTDQWKKIEAAWEESAEHWQKGAIAAQWRATLDKIDNWLRANESMVQRVDLGDTVYSVERLMRQCEDLIHEAKDQHELLQRASRGIDQLSSNDRPALQQRCRQLDDRLNDLMRQLENRKPMLNQALQFFRNADTAGTRLHALQGEVHGADAGRIGSYAGKAREIGGPVISQGHTLISSAGGLGQSGTRGINDKVTELESIMAQIENLCTSKSREVAESFDREYRSVHQWLHDVCDQFLHSNRYMGETLNEINNFMSKYRGFIDDLSSREGEIYSLGQRARAANSPDLIRQAQEIQKKHEAVKSTAERRLALANLYLNAVKYISESSATFDSMDSLLTTAPPGEMRAQHELQEMWTSIETIIRKFKEHNAKFTQESRPIAVNDRGFDVESSARRLQLAESEAEERRRRLNDRWAKWREAQQQMQALTRVIEEVEYWIQEVTEVIIDTEKRTERTRTSEEVNSLLRVLDPYERSKIPIEHKLHQAEQQATELRVEETEHRVNTTRRKYKTIVDRLVEMRHHLTSLVQTFQAKELQEAMKPPKFTQMLQDGAVDEGRMFELTCFVQADPEPSITWYKDGLSLSGSADYKTTYNNGLCILHIQQAFVEDSAVYTCRATNEAGTAETRSRLAVRGVPKGHAPTISPTLVNQVVMEGQRIAFETKITGVPTPDIKWFHNDRQLFSAGEIQLIAERNGWHKCVVTKASADHHGLYRVEASNQHGSDRSQALLTVQPIQPRVVTEEYFEQHTGYSPSATAPEFVRPFSSEYQLRIGQKARLECVLVGNPRPKVQWLFNDRPLLPQNELCTFSNLGDTYAINIARVGPEHQGTWELRAENIRGQAECITRTIVSNVQEESQSWAVRQTYKAVSPMPTGTPPHFSQTLVSVVCTIGEECKFEGSVTGTPPPEISWTKDGQPFNPNSQPNVRFQNVNGRVTLTFLNATPENSGKYTCTAKNQVGVATSSAQIVVQTKTQAPDFLQRLISREVAEGEQLRWSVKVTGDPKPNIRWLRNGEPIPNCAEVQLVEEGNNMYTMLIVKVERADAGQFTALAENVAGEARSTADLVVRAAGSAPNPYYHVTKVTQAKQMHGQEVARNESYTVEQPSPGGAPGEPMFKVAKR